MNNDPKFIYGKDFILGKIEFSAADRHQSLGYVTNDILHERRS